MNLFNLSILALILAVLSLLASLWALWNIRSLNCLRRTFFAGRTGTDLENVLEALASDLASAKSEQLALQESLAKLYQAFGFAVQKVGVVRFNPFADGGGNFSFTLALLDGHNSGVVITSLHGREQNRIYSKKIIDGKTENPLTEEEQQAIDMANSK